MCNQLRPVEDGLKNPGHGWKFICGECLGWGDETVVPAEGLSRVDG